MKIKLVMIILLNIFVQSAFANDIIFFNKSAHYRMRLDFSNGAMSLIMSRGSASCSLEALHNGFSISCYKNGQNEALHIFSVEPENLVGLEADSWCNLSFNESQCALSFSLKGQGVHYLAPQSQADLFDDGWGDQGDHEIDCGDPTCSDDEKHHEHEDGERFWIIGTVPIGAFK
ncbi:hypothetical protein K2W90_01515 [Candidatus Babeliales bacterium]|nr:hypothetical protein [Candidatus Babeliales bacterium]